MKLIIDIDEELYEAYKGRPPMLGDEGMDMIAQAIANGIPYEERPQNAKHCNTCLHYQQLTNLQELGYCETKNYHVSANSDKCIHYKEKQ